MKKPTSTDLRGEQIRAALKAIAAANSGFLNPVHVVQQARDPGSVLHDEFEWKDDAAAQAYRLAQASALIRRVKLTLLREDAQSKQITVHTTRAFQSRPSKRTEDGGYESVEQIMADPAKRDELSDQVLSELTAYRKRYADLLALSSVWVAIDDAMDALGASAPSRPAKAAQAGHGVAR
jgi:hypothetical protein